MTLDISRYSYFSVWVVVALVSGGCELGEKRSSARSGDPRIVVNRSDPRVALMWEEMQRVDRTELGFEPLPASIPRSTVLRLHPQPEGCDVSLHLLGERVDRVAYFDEQEGGFVWIGEMEFYSAPGQRGSWGNPPDEFIVIAYQTRPINQWPIKELVVSHIRGGSSVANSEDLSREIVKPILEQWNNER